MAGAPYQYDLSLSADGTFEHSIDDLRMEDGSPFPFAEYAIEYAVSRDGCQVMLRTQAAGVAVDADQGAVTFSGPMPAPGSYAHAMRLRHLATGKIAPLFGGALIIEEGLF